MKLTKRHWLTILILVLFVYVIVPQIAGFKSSLQLLDDVRWSWLGRAIALALLTYVAAAGTYYWLAFRRLSFIKTVVVELASSFANRLLPAGIGNLGVNYRYLRRHNHSSAQATAVVTLNNLIGFAGHCLLLAVLLILFGKHLPQLSFSLSQNSLWLALAVAIFLLILAMALPKWRQRLWRAAKSTLRQIGNYRHRPARLLLALTTSLAMTSCNVLSFWFCLRALNLPVAFITALLVFTFGVAIAAATPTPGGLGGVEAALVAGLVAYKVGQSQALAAVILYRLVYYWFGLLLGALSWPLVRRRGYLA